MLLCWLAAPCPLALRECALSLLEAALQTDPPPCCPACCPQVVALANLLPPDSATDEMDSYMYQTVGHQLVAAYAGCMGLPLYRRRIVGGLREEVRRAAPACWCHRTP